MAEATRVRPAYSAARQRVRRDLLGCVVAPLPASIARAVDGFSSSVQEISGFADGLETVIVAIASGYGIALAWGLPVHELLSWRKLRRWWHYALGDVAIAVLMFLILVWVTSDPIAEQWIMLPIIGAHVVPTALFFWLVAVRRRPEAAGSPSPG